MDHRRENRLAQKAYRRVELQNQDQGIEWHVFDSVNSSMHDIYDEGPSRVWVRSVHVPIIWAQRTEDVQNDSDRGLIAYADIHVAIRRQTWDDLGLGDPQSRDTLSAIFEWDGKRFSVIGVEPAGRFGFTEDSVVVVSARETHPDEFVNDAVIGEVPDTEIHYDDVIDGGEADTMFVTHIDGGS